MSFRHSKPGTKSVPRATRSSVGEVNPPEPLQPPVNDVISQEMDSETPNGNQCVFCHLPVDHELPQPEQGNDSADKREIGGHFMKMASRHLGLNCSAVAVDANTCGNCMLLMKSFLEQYTAMENAKLRANSFIMQMHENMRNVELASRSHVLERIFQGEKGRKKGEKLQGFCHKFLQTGLQTLSRPEVRLVKSGLEVVNRLNADSCSVNSPNVDLASSLPKAVELPPQNELLTPTQASPFGIVAVLRDSSDSDSESCDMAVKVRGRRQSRKSHVPAFEKSIRTRSLTESGKRSLSEVTPDEEDCSPRRKKVKEIMPVTEEVHGSSFNVDDDKEEPTFEKMAIIEEDILELPSEHCLPDPIVTAESNDDFGVLPGNATGDENENGQPEDFTAGEGNDFEDYFEDQAHDIEAIKSQSEGPPCVKYDIGVWDKGVVDLVSDSDGEDEQAESKSAKHENNDDMDAEMYFPMSAEGGSEEPARSEPQIGENFYETETEKDIPEADTPSSTPPQSLREVPMIVLVQGADGSSMEKVGNSLLAEHHQPIDNEMDVTYSYNESKSEAASEDHSFTPGNSGCEANFDNNTNEYENSDDQDQVPMDTSSPVEDVKEEVRYDYEEHLEFDDGGFYVPEEAQSFHGDGEARSDYGAAHNDGSAYNDFDRSSFRDYNDNENDQNQNGGMETPPPPMWHTYTLKQVTITTYGSFPPTEAEITRIISYRLNPKYSSRFPSGSGHRHHHANHAARERYFNRGADQEPFCTFEWNDLPNRGQPRAGSSDAPPQANFSTPPHHESRPIIVEVDDDEVQPEGDTDGSVTIEEVE